MLPHFLFFSFWTNTVVARYYSHYSLDESTYLCENLHSEPLKFGDGMESAVVFNFHSKKSFHCQFEIAPRSVKHGIVAVIQNMHFRLDQETGKCIDYIMFKGAKSKYGTKTYCGNFDVETAMENYVYRGATYIAMSVKNTYQHVISDGLIVIIHMNMNDDNYFDAGAELVLTSYTDCHENPPWFYKPCINKNFDTICIEDIYFGDGYVNCPFRGCVDEGTCVPLLVKYYGKRIFLGVLVGIVLSICLSASCFYLCTPRKSPRQGDLPPNYMLPSLDEATEYDTADENQQGGGDTSVESAEKWDKPPMYESLFPNSQSSFIQA